MKTRFLSLIPLLLACLFVCETADAQSIFERARRAAERGAERAVEREAERRADRAVTGTIECVAGDRQCIERAEADGQEVRVVEQPAPDPQPEPAPEPEPEAQDADDHEHDDHAEEDDPRTALSMMPWLDRSPELDVRRAT